MFPSCAIFGSKTTSADAVEGCIVPLRIAKERINTITSKHSLSLQKQELIMSIHLLALLKAFEIVASLQLQ
jgi:hypothetical protein